MVEFGLKLEDNKVSEWGDRYIRYEKLKGYLKKCGHARKRYDELAAKKPFVAAKVEDAYRMGLPTPMPSRETLSGASLGALSPLDQPPSSSSVHGSVRSVSGKSEEASTKEEASSLLGGASGSSNYDSVPGGNKGSETNPLSRVLESAASGVSDYFSKSYERQVKDALKSVDRYAGEFERCLLEDIDRVNGFYRDTMTELEDRLSLLKESVSHLFGNQHHHQQQPPPPPDRSETGSSAASGGAGAVGTVDADGNDNGDYFVGDSGGGSGGGRTTHILNLGDTLDEDYLRTPLVHHKKRQGPLAKAVAKLHKRKRRSSAAHGQQQEQEQGGGGGGGGGGSAEGGVQMEPFHHSFTVEEEVVDTEAAERRAREVDWIQRSLVDMYRRTKLLHNYSIVNYSGFVKIVKKHDKTIPSHKGKYKQMIRPANICNEGKDVEKLADYMERIYANWFCDGSVSEARVQLLPKRGDGLEMDWSQLRLGYRLGMGSILGLWVCWDCIWGMMSSGKSTIGGRTAFPVFRACGGLLLLQWFWGCSVWVWTRYRVNYIFLFDFNPHIVASPLTIFNEAVDNSLVFLFGMLLYYKAGAHDVPGVFPAGVFPAALVAYTLYKLIFPLKIRGPMWMSIWLVVTAPMHSPTFFHGYIGDIFTSMVKVFQDMVWALCFLGSGDWLISEDVPASTKHPWSKSTWYSKFLIPILTLSPLIIRFNQCLRRYADTGTRWPHLANAFKYALSMTVTLFGAFHPLYLERYAESNMFQLFWMMTFVTSSLYSFCWDVYMDWYVFPKLRICLVLIRFVI